MTVPDCVRIELYAFTDSQMPIISTVSSELIANYTENILQELKACGILKSPSLLSNENAPAVHVDVASLNPAD